jgi:hypothetical protein
VLELALADVADPMALLRAIEGRLPGIVTTQASGDSFLFYDPDGVTVPEARFPFCTIVTGDRYDAASLLDRNPATYRVNVGVDRPAYEALFGPAPREAAGYGVIDTGSDYTLKDTLLPHPVYAPLHWLCVVDPGDHTRAELATVLERAHAVARRKYDNQRSRTAGGSAV